MPVRPRRLFRLPLVSAFLVILVACGSGDGGNVSASDGSGACSPGDSPVITLAAYSNPYVAYGKITTNFANEWKEEHDQSLIWQLSFGGSTTQATNIVNGFKADVYASSTAPDVEMVQDAGLITHDWQDDTDGSIVQSGVVAFAVRPGNPKGIENWDDLTQPGLQILTPDPAQSGGAKWNIVAAYGAAMRGGVPGVEANDPAAAEGLLKDIFTNVAVLDKSANDSIKNFESGNGDVAITYEYAVLQAQAAGGDDQMVIPPSTVAIKTPTVVVDKNASDHCVLPIANAFVKYLHTPDAQAVFHDVGFERPVDVKKAQKGDGDKLARIKDLFTTDDLGGWDQLESDTVFGPNGAFTNAFEEAKG
jgi:sulfate/thiosulfate-binding protein